MNYRETQRALSRLGYRPGRLDGRPGPKSEAAVEAFKCDHALAGAGLDVATLARLDDRLREEQKVSADLVLTAAELHAILSSRGRTLTRDRFSVVYPALRDALVESCIAASPDREASFLAQLFHESGGLRYFEEIASGSAYEGRRDLGNVKRGDGRRYKGRGPIQLTGRANYRYFGEILGVDLEGNPERAADPDVGFRIAALYWTDRNLSSVADTASDGRDAAERAFVQITRAINGGTNGIDDRRAWLAVAWRVIAA